MNWGNKLLVTFIVFGTAMSFLVYKSINTKSDLVSKEYYKDELAYQQVIDGTKNANALANKINITHNEKFITIQLPGELKGQPATGNILFYCAADASNDRKFDLKPDADGKQLLGKNMLAAVNYKVKIDWTVNGEHFYTETEFKK